MQIFLLILFATFQNYNYKLTGLLKPKKFIMTVIMKKKILFNSCFAETFHSTEGIEERNDL